MKLRKVKLYVPVNGSDIRASCYNLVKSKHMFVCFTPLDYERFPHSKCLFMWEKKGESVYSFSIHITERGEI